MNQVFQRPLPIDTGNLVRPRPIIYIRRSSDRKTGSVERQLENALEYCERNKLGDPIIIIDEGQTGLNGDRDGFQEMMSIMQEHHYCDVVIESLSRSARDVIPRLQFEIVRRQTFARVHALRHGGVMDAFTEKVSAASDEKDYDNIGYNNRAGWLQAAKEGKWVFLPPWGTVRGSDGVPYVNPDLKEHLVGIFKLRADGMSGPAIAAELQRQKVKLRGKAGEWKADAVYAILKNRHYTGHVHISRKKFEWERGRELDPSDVTNPTYAEFDVFIPTLAAISIELFESVQPKKKAKKPRLRAEFVPHKLVRCPCCGKPMVARRKDVGEIIYCETPSSECDWRGRLSVVEVERALLDGIGKVIGKSAYAEQFKEKYDAEVARLEHVILTQHVAVDRQIASAKDNYANLRQATAQAREDVRLDFEEDLSSAKRQLTELKALKATLPSRITHVLESREVQPWFADAIAMVKAELPIRPTGNTALLHNFLSTHFVQSIAVVKRDDDRYDLTFTFRLAVIMAGEKVIDSVLEVVKVPARRIGMKQLNHRGRRDRVAELVAKSRITLSATEKKLMEDVPGLASLSHPPVLDALELGLTAASAGDDFRFFSLSRAAGLSRSVHHHFHSMLVTADLAEIEHRLSEHRGVAVKMLRPLHAATLSIESHFSELRNPILLMELAWTEKRHAALSNSQFDAVVHLLPKAHSARTWREWFDRLFHLTRNGFAIGSGQLLSGIARKALRKLHHGGALTNILAVWLEMEGWNIPEGFVAGPLFCRGNPPKYRDPDVVRRELAQSLGMSLEEAADRFPDRRNWFAIGPCLIDIDGGVIREPSGILTEFVFSGTLREMFSRRGEWVMPSMEKLAVYGRAHKLRRKLLTAGWRVAKKNFTISRHDGLKIEF